MKRFYNNEDDDDKESLFDSDSDLDDNEDFDDDDLIGVIDQQGILDVMQMDLAQTQLNQDLLNKAIKIAENSWFWKFKPNLKKIDKIEEIYRRLINIIEETSNSPVIKDVSKTESESENENESERKE